MSCLPPLRKLMTEMMHSSVDGKQLTATELELFVHAENEVRGTGKSAVRRHRGVTVPPINWAKWKKTEDATSWPVPKG